MLTNKKCGVDLVILLDATANMKQGLPTLKQWLKSLFVQFFGEEKEDSEFLIQNWRAKIVGYRNVVSDYEWIDNNPFVSDVNSIENQLRFVEAKGSGGKSPSLLDALLTVGNMESASQGTAVDEWQWRNVRDAIRCIIVFSNNPYEPSLLREDYVGMAFEDVARRLMEKRIILEMVTTSTPFDKLVSQEDFMDCYRKLAYIDRSDWIPLLTAQGLPMDFSEPGVNSVPIAQFLVKEILKVAQLPIGFR